MSNNMSKEWSLSISPQGEIFVERLDSPKFKVQIIIEAGPHISFQAKWKDAKPQDGQDELRWYLKALEIYNNAPKSS